MSRPSDGMCLLYECDICGASFRIPRMDEDLNILSVRMYCPVRECTGEVQIVSEVVDGTEVKLVSAKEFFEACHGRGFKEERRCSPEALQTLLTGAVITEVDLEPVSADKDRSIINSMRIFVNDDISMRVFFAMSNHGATIYKVIKDGV